MLGQPFVQTVAEEDDEDLVKVDGKFVKVPDWRKTYAVLEAKNESEEGVYELLMDAAKRNDIRIVKSLVVDSKINPNSRDKKGWTALMRCAKMEHLEIMNFLIKFKANLENKSKEGNTALHKAVKRGKLEAAKMLLAAGADVDCENKGKATPLMLACMHKTAGPLVEELVRWKADLNAQKDVGYTALMICCRMGHTKVTQMLLDRRANPELHDKQGETAIVKAQKYRHPEIGAMLRAAGARPDPHHPDFGRTSNSSHMTPHSTHRSGHPNATHRSGHAVSFAETPARSSAHKSRGGYPR